MDNDNAAPDPSTIFDQEQWFSADLFTDQDVNFSSGVDLSISPGDGINNSAINAEGVSTPTFPPEMMGNLHSNTNIFGSSSSASSSSSMKFLETANIDLNNSIYVVDRNPSSFRTNTNTGIDITRVDGRGRRDRGLLGYGGQATALAVTSAGGSNPSRKSSKKQHDKEKSVTRPSNKKLLLDDKEKSTANTNTCQLLLLATLLLVQLIAIAKSDSLQLRLRPHNYEQYHDHYSLLL